MKLKLPPPPPQASSERPVVLPAPPPPGRDEKGLWLPGTPSPNPRGRPVVAAEVKKLARCYGQEAINSLAAMLADPNCPPATRKAAADSLLDRGYGKAVQMIEAGPAGAFENIADDELNAYIREKAQKLLIDDAG